MKFHSERLERVFAQGSEDEGWREDYELAQKGTPNNGVELDNGVLYYKGRLYIPDDEDLRKLIVEREHDSMVAGHMGQDKTVDLVQRNLFWHNMDAWIRDYVRS